MKAHNFKTFLLVCKNISDTKRLFKLIQVFPQQNILSNDISKLAQLLMNYTNFEKTDRIF